MMREICLSMCTLEFLSVHADSLKPIVFLKVRSLSSYACSEKNFQDAHILYIGHGHAVHMHLQQIKARLSELMRVRKVALLYLLW